MTVDSADASNARKTIPVALATSIHDSAFSVCNRRLEGVKTEFVYADGAKDDVQLSGDWNDWKAIQMFHEGGGMWSVVTPVPPGPHEFKFIVDGEWKHSNRHPTIGMDEMSLNNVRYVLAEPDLGPSNTQQSRPQRRDSRATSIAIQDLNTTGAKTKKKSSGFFSKGGK